MRFLKYQTISLEIRPADWKSLGLHETDGGLYRVLNLNIILVKQRGKVKLSSRYFMKALDSVTLSVIECHRV